MAEEHGKILAQWSFPEYTRPERSKSWYFWFIIFVILLLLYSLITVNFLFAVIVIMAAIIVLIRGRTEPNQVDFAILEDGRMVEDKFFGYETIRYFYILYKPPELKNLYLEFKSVLKPRLIIPLENQNPLNIRDILNGHLEENLEKEEEPASEAFRKVLKL